MDKQRIAERLSAVLGTRVSVGLHRRIDDAYETERWQERVGMELKPMLDAEGRPVMVPVLDAAGRPVKGEDGKPALAQRLVEVPVLAPRERRVLAGQTVVELGERFTYRGEDGAGRPAEVDVPAELVAEAAAWCEANPPPPKKTEGEMILDALEAEGVLTAEKRAAVAARLMEGKR